MHEKHSFTQKSQDSNTAAAECTQRPFVEKLRLPLLRANVNVNVNVCRRERKRQRLPP
jgi:hypothetical protein